MINIKTKFLFIFFIIAVAPFVPYTFLIPLCVTLVFLGLPMAALIVGIFLDVLLVPSEAIWYGHLFIYVAIAVPLYWYFRYSINI